MKKIFKNKRISNIIFGVIGIVSGVVIGGIVGVTATTNKLEAKYVMYTKDGETMTVQDAIKDLYVLAKNNGGSVTNLALTPQVSGSNISIAYTGIYTDVKCVYGTDENYGNVGKLEGNKCTISGMPNVTYYYKITALNNAGEIYSGSDSSTTKAGATIVKSELPTGAKAIVYLDPTNLGATCNASNSTVGGTATSGCMKWYAFKEDTNSYTMILDHNTYAKGTWENTKSALSTLQSQTGWNNLNTRMITANEIATITGNTSWTAGGSGFFFNGNSSSSQATGSNIYYWLFDYTNGCTSWGCNVADSSNQGYWTDTAYTGSSGYAWSVRYSGQLYYGDVSARNFSLRPVITVSKSNF